LIPDELVVQRFVRSGPERGATSTPLWQGRTTLWT